MKNNPNTAQFWAPKIQNLVFIPNSDYVTKDRISKTVSLLPNKSISLLDIGVGYGFLEKKIKKIKPLIKVYGLDITTERLRTLSIEDYGNFVGGTATELPFKDNFFDCVCLLEVLEHLYEDEGVKSLNEVSRILRNGGTLIVSVPLFDKPFTDHPSGHVRGITPEKIIQEVKDGRFEIERLIPLVAFKSHYFLKTIVNKIIPLRRPNNLIIEASKL